jgi:predicted Zn-dependent protease with MMP-like domain
MSSQGPSAPLRPKMGAGSGAADEEGDEIDAEQVLLEALDALYELADEDPDDALEMFRSFPVELREHREFRIARAAIEKSSGDLESAVRTLRALLSEDELDADVHHMLADALEDAGDERAATQHFLRTWELDAEHPIQLDAATEDAIVTRAREAIVELPVEFRSRLTQVPISLEDRPTKAEVEEGLDPRSLGVFEGLPFGEGDEEPLPPTRIVLYAQNLASEFSDEELLDQVAITILHEVGHYFGLDEDDLERIGLD